MKQFKSIYIVFTAAVVLSSYSCNKALDLKPLDQLSDASYWQSANDFMLAANAFYAYERNWNDIIFNTSTTTSFNPHSDYNSDIMGAQNAFSRGINTVPATDNYWNSNYSSSTINGVVANFATGAWSRIRQINYLLSKASAYS